MFSLFWQEISSIYEKYLLKATVPAVSEMIE